MRLHRYTLTPQTPYLVLAVLLVVSGAARSVGFTAYNTMAFADVESANMTRANTLASTVQQVAAGFGVAVAAVVLRAGAPLGGPGSSAPYNVTFAVIAVMLAVACLEACSSADPQGKESGPLENAAPASFTIWPTPTDHARLVGSSPTRPTSGLPLARSASDPRRLSS